jgi:hypothetical protein
LEKLSTTDEKAAGKFTFRGPEAKNTVRLDVQETTKR